jgi:hypothetical protein
VRIGGPGGPWMRAVAIRNPILSKRNRATGRDGGVAQCIEAVAPLPSRYPQSPWHLGVSGQCNAKVLFPICDPTTRTAAAPDGLSRSEASRSANKSNRGRLETDDLHRTAWRVHGIRSFLQSGDRMRKGRWLKQGRRAQRAVRGCAGSSP